MSRSLEQVAQVYLAASQLDSPSPTSDVAMVLGLSKSAAAKRVARARAVGLIPPTTKGKALQPVHRPVRAVIRNRREDKSWTVCDHCLVTWPCALADHGLLALEAAQRPS